MPKNVITVAKCAPSDKLDLINAIKSNNVQHIHQYDAYQYICRYDRVTKDLKMRMSNCDNAKNKVSHPLQRVLMKSTTEEHVHS